MQKKKNKTHDEQSLKILNEVGASTAESSLCVRIQCGRHGVERYTTHRSLRTLQALETLGTCCPMTSALLNMHIFLPGFLHWAAWQLPPLCLLFPGLQLPPMQILPGPTQIPLFHEAFLTTLTPPLPHICEQWLCPSLKCCFTYVCFP